VCAPAFAPSDTEVALHQQQQQQPVTVRAHVLQSSSDSTATPEFALQTTVAALQFFSALFPGTPYPLAKLDLIAVHQMTGLGMENYGAISVLQVCEVLFCTNMCNYAQTGCCLQRV
jgi:aminopeptidase N